MKQASLLIFPVWLTSLQSSELKAMSVMISVVILPEAQILLTVLLSLARGISSCVYSRRVGHRCVVFEQQSATSQPLAPWAILIFHRAALGLDVTVALW